MHQGLGGWGVCYGDWLVNFYTSPGRDVDMDLEIQELTLYWQEPTNPNSTSTTSPHQH